MSLGSGKNSYFMNGVPQLLILQELSQQEMYGYQLVRAIKTRTNGAIFLSEGCAYPLLHELERKKWIKSRRTVIDGRARVYYGITGEGKKRLKTIAAKWDELAQTIRSALGTTHDYRPA
jgi:PadR family transcriptional regulator, regulatory protein PadR